MQQPVPVAGSFKRLAVFLDGTWNSVGTNTNVWRLRCLCADNDAAGGKQLRYYDQGVNGVFGGGWGKGLSENVQQAYDWLVDNYDDGDQIFIFGFSRGAYTARSLAGLLAICGLLRPGGALGVDQLYARYKQDDNRTIFKLAEIKPEELSFEEKWMLKYSRPVAVEMVGVWDTVGAVGVPLFSIEGISSSTLQFHHTGLRQAVKHGFHALALDEHRPKFEPTLWTIRTAQGAQPKTRAVHSVEQRWFVGAHANVGGGCHNDSLAQLPLSWMMRKAGGLGLAFKSQLELDGSEHRGTISDSYKEFLKGVYSKVFNRSFRPIGAAPTKRDTSTHANVNETIDVSVFQRFQEDSAYRPPNLISWAEKRRVAIDSLRASVSASDPSITVE